MVLRYKYLLLYFSFISAFLKGQEGFIHFSSENGLPSSEIFDIMQDKKGFIWIASDGGVSRYDGYRFENFTLTGGLTDNIVLNIFEDEKGSIWFSTFSGNIAYYNYSTSNIEKYRYNDSLEKYFGNRKFFRNMIVNKNDELLLGYIGKGKAKILPQGKLISYKTIKPLCENQYTVEEVNGHILFYSEKHRTNSKKKYDHITIRTDKTDTSFTLKQHPLLLNNLTACKRKNGNCIIYVPGLVIETGSNGKCSMNPINDDVYRFFEDQQQRLWVCMKNGGLRRYEPGSTFSEGKFTELFKNTSITMAFEDNAGGMWVSTLNEGIYYRPKYNIEVKKYPGLLQGKFPSALLASDSFLVAAVDDDKLYRIESENSCSSFTLPHGHVSALETNNDNILLSCNGLYLFEKNGSFKKLFPDEKTGQTNFYTYCFLFTDSLILAAGNGFLVKFSSGPLYLYKSSDTLAGIQVGKIITYKNQVLAGTTKGILYYEAGKFKIHTQLDASGSLRISEMKKFGNKLAVATLGRGVWIMDGTKTKNITVRDGLLSDNVKSLDVYGNSLWLASSSGINEIRFEADSFNIHTYTIANGLPMNEIKKVCVFKKALWFVTPKGLFSFSLEQRKEKNDSLPVMISKVHTNDTNYTGSTIGHLQKIGYNQNVVIDFVGLDYKQKGNIEYRYRLFGSDTNWRETVSTHVEFSFLTSGEYRFEVSAKNENGIWNSKPVSFSFYVSPPVWKTWWFMLSSISLLILIISLIFLNRINQLKKINKQKEQILEYRHKALISQINPHFIFNSLNSIYSFILTEDKRNAAKYLSQFSKLMRLSLDNSMSDYISLRKDIEALLLYIELEALRFKDQFSFSITLDETIDQDAILIPAMLIQPFIENSI
ncbi:MAG: histidine kinase, partial [Bacteroidia bacterium]|nr:histidine kinase [Bacteroidia bacterium]